MVTLESLECFCRGTLILTDRGDIPVEELRIGDLVRTVIGKSEEPVIGINQRQVDCSRHPKPRQVWPVRIAAGTFGHRRPVRELWLSPDHAVILAERLAVESYLDNGDRMVFHPDGDQVRLFPDFAALVMTGPELAAARRMVKEIVPRRRYRPVAEVTDAG